MWCAVMLWQVEQQIVDDLVGQHDRCVRWGAWMVHDQYRTAGWLRHDRDARFGDVYHPIILSPRPNRAVALL